MYNCGLSSWIYYALSKCNYVACVYPLEIIIAAYLGLLYSYINDESFGHVCSVKMQKVMQIDFTVATITPQCHISPHCSDAFPENIAPCGDCCNTPGHNSFRMNSFSACVPCRSKGEATHRYIT